MLPMTKFASTEVKTPETESDQWDFPGLPIWWDTWGEWYSHIHGEESTQAGEEWNKKEAMTKIKLVCNTGFCKQGKRRLQQRMENSANSTEGKAAHGSMDVCAGNRWQHSSTKQRLLHITESMKSWKSSLQLKKCVPRFPLPICLRKALFSRTRWICQSRTLVLTVLYNCCYILFLQSQNTQLSFSWCLIKWETEPDSNHHTDLALTYLFSV